MCRHCRHDSDVGPIVAKYWWPFNGNKKEMLKAISIRLNAIKKERKKLQQSQETTAYLDYERDALRFAAWALNYNYQQNKGWKPGGWLNGADDFHPQQLFVA